MNAEQAVLTGQGSRMPQSEEMNNTGGGSDLNRLGHQSTMADGDSAKSIHGTQQQQQLQVSQDKAPGHNAETDDLGSKHGNHALIPSDQLDQQVPTIAAMLAAGCNLDLSQAMAAGKRQK
jgi:hypothetical protein